MNAPNPDTGSEEHHSQVKLLIVDDDPTTCQLLALQLEMEGYASATLSDPAQILEAIAAELPALILADYHLGLYDGLDLLRTVRGHEACRSLPVVVMSALDHRRESVSAGANGFVLKPFGLHELVTAIHKALES